MAVPVIVVAEGLVKRYGERRVLAGVDLTAPGGSVLALLGPNGAGKTTTVRVLSTLTRPDGGRARIAGHDVVTDAFAVRGVIGLNGVPVDSVATVRPTLDDVFLALTGSRPAAATADPVTA